MPRGWDPLYLGLCAQRIRSASFGSAVRIVYLLFHLWVRPSGSRTLGGAPERRWRRTSRCRYGCRSDRVLGTVGSPNGVGFGGDVFWNGGMVFELGFGPGYLGLELRGLGV